ncbi:4a-hydroxytetrahydrobiopterin dehydratase [Sphingomonas xanthus]|uniref:Putative pterin-4-alpha-carbinolamine dehydratase n=2 Tax=Sphingomonas xanthus TaxID=2594473 RepID=A0A516IUK0_9SPHN|nr:4a-hydroxytetrahydrobiopterin dehydratase [Sphingomonas xanthus]
MDRLRRRAYAWSMDIPEGWTLSEDGKALTRTLRLADFSEAFALLSRVALHAEKVDHHPEFTSVWNRIDFRLTSHDAGGVTRRDIALAEAINQLAS